MMVLDLAACRNKDGGCPGLSRLSRKGTALRRVMTPSSGFRDGIVALRRILPESGPSLVSLCRCRPCTVGTYNS